MKKEYGFRREPIHIKSCTNNGNVLVVKLKKENPLSKPLLGKLLKKLVFNFTTGNQNSVSMTQNLTVMCTSPTLKQPNDLNGLNWKNKVLGSSLLENNMIKWLKMVLLLLPIPRTSFKFLVIWTGNISPKTLIISTLLLII